MPDPGHSQAEWTHFVGEEEGYCWLVPMRDLEEAANRLLLERVRVENCVDWNSNVTAVTLAGVIYGQNTDARGRIFLRFTANGGDWDVDLYRATGGGGGDKVAHVTALADAATGTLVADNSSGITGTITIGAAVVAESNDRHYLKCYVDFRLVAKAFETDADSVSDENASASYKAMIESYTAAGNAVRSALTGLIAGFARFGISDQGTPTAKGRTFLESADASVFQETQRRDSDGNVLVDQSGLFVTQRVDMLAETTGGTQDVVRRVPSAGAGVFPASNAGMGTIAAHTPSEAALEMTITGRCTRGVDTGSLGSEQFEVSYNYLDKGQRRVSTAPVNLQVSKTWTGPLGIGPIQLVRTHAKTGDGADLNLAPATGATAPSLTGENNSNTDEGVLYWQVFPNGGNWDIEFYSSSTYGSTTQVSKATNVLTAANFTAAAQNGSGLTVAWKVGTAPVAFTTGTLLLNPFKVQNSVRIADSFTIAVAIAAAPGAFQSVVGRMFPGAYLNSTTLGGESISDDYVKAGFQEFVDANP